jgi:hypothetical protein
MELYGLPIELQWTRLDMCFIGENIYTAATPNGETQQSIKHTNIFARGISFRLRVYLVRSKIVDF